MHSSIHFIIDLFMVYFCFTGISVLSRDSVILGCDSPYAVIATLCLYLEVVKHVSMGMFGQCASVRDNT